MSYRLPQRHPGIGWIYWRLRAESNRRTRLCRPLHDHSATQPLQGAFLLSVFFRDCGVGAVPVHRLGRILMYWHTPRFCARRPDTSDRPALAEKSGLLETPLVSYCILIRRQKKPRSNRGLKTGAGNEIRTRDPNLGKVVLYQLSYSRKRAAIL